MIYSKLGLYSYTSAPFQGDLYMSQTTLCHLIAGPPNQGHSALSMYLQELLELQYRQGDWGYFLVPGGSTADHAHYSLQGLAGRVAVTFASLAPPG